MAQRSEETERRRALFPRDVGRAAQGNLADPPGSHASLTTVVVVVVGRHGHHRWALVDYGFSQLDRLADRRWGTGKRWMMGEAEEAAMEPQVDRRGDERDGVRATRWRTPGWRARLRTWRRRKPEAVPGGGTGDGTGTRTGPGTGTHSWDRATVRSNRSSRMRPSKPPPNGSWPRWRLRRWRKRRPRSNGLRRRRGWRGTNPTTAGTGTSSTATRATRTRCATTSSSASRRWG